MSEQIISVKALSEQAVAVKLSEVNLLNERSIQNFSNHDLLESLNNYFEADRRTTHMILLHLKEIQRRKLFADRGYPNLFAMLIQYFHLSESAANQRIQALRLMNDVPEVESGLINGELNLSTLAMAQRQIRREEQVTGKKIDANTKNKIVESISCKTMAQAEKELMQLLPESAKILPTFERRISENTIRLSLTIPDRVKEKLERLKNHWAAVNPNMDYLEIIERSLDIALAKTDPIRKSKPRHENTPSLDRLEKEGDAKFVKQSATESVAQNSMQNAQPVLDQFIVPKQLNESPSSKLLSNFRHKRKTYYSVSINKILWERAGSQCEYVDQHTGHRCDSRFGLERDHILPLAKGGSNEIQNLRLFCRAHNQLMARRHFGADRIQAAASRTS